MTREIQIPNSQETLDTLEAARSAMGYANAYVRSARLRAPDRRRIHGPLEKALTDVDAVRTPEVAPNALRGNVANAVAHLRAVLKAMQELDAGNETLGIAMRAAARALSLLYPLTQTEEPILLVARKKRPISRRRPAVTGDDDKRTVLFEVEVGQDTATNFFTGFAGDIRSGGLFIATYDIFPVGSRLTVCARLQGGAVLTEEAEVTWVREYNEGASDVAPGMGVVFCGLDRRAEEEIERFLASRESIFYEAV